MENETKIKELLEAEDKSISAIQAKIAELDGRASAFRLSLNALNGSSEPSFKLGIEDKIHKCEQNSAELQLKLLGAQARRSAYEDFIKMLTGGGVSGLKDLRQGSELARVRDAIRKAGKPITLNEITQLIGSANDKKKMISLRSTLRRYANDGRIFTKDDENGTFGLLEFKKE